MSWIDIADLSELKQAQKLCIPSGTTSILLFWWKETAHAVENQCSHAFKKLDGGTFENGIIQCPFHGARFCVETGEHLSPPAFKGIKRFETRIEGNKIQIKP
ncbi:MAG: Rieske 2Fe-2S domain-containing protein [Pseudomonadales bacterium]|nr:Rieske 2Fe-2S domain-containing protein [Pseudomonadales bacterium]